MHNLAGSFKLLSILMLVLIAAGAEAREISRPSNRSVIVRPPGQPAKVVTPSPVESSSFGAEWTDFSKRIELQKKADRENGLSYVISGSIGLAGGIAGALITDDAIEKGIYSIFQTIGVAAIGYGSYTWLVGGEDRGFYEILNASGLDPQQKMRLLEVRDLKKKEREKKERLVKAITHGLIAGLNIYSAQQQSNSTLKTGLYFVGGVNLLAAFSYTFEF